ncbi:hypothetical protein LINPERPRIM_LOCUS27294, partial [Linum perenne]
LAVAHLAESHRRPSQSSLHLVGQHIYGGFVEPFLLLSSDTKVTYAGEPNIS